MSFLKHKDSFRLCLFIVLFIFIRSLHFSSSLNFSSDQATFATKAHEIFIHRELTLIGPATSLNFDGRQIFQGSIIYYFLLLFLLAGHFDPIISSYLFMIFCSLMIIPLFIGTKLLINKNAALFLVIIYSLLPFYIAYTKFLWNPNFQLALSPLLILLIGYYKKKPNSVILLATGILSGILLQFHYQFILVIAVLIIYFTLILKKRKSQLVYLFLGLITGFFPILLFEVRNNFYNFNTLILYLHNFNSILSSGQHFQYHYLLTVFFFILILVANLLRKVLTKSKLIILFFSLLVISLFRYLPQPVSGFGMSDNWNYPDEEKAFNIIRSENLKNYDATNLIYDTKAQVQKYLIVKSNLPAVSEDYHSNNYLFVISPNNKDFSSDPAFEITRFKPFEIVNAWQITDFHSLYLLKKLPGP